MSLPTSDAYDVVVVGGGLGGIAAAAPLAKAGRKVLVLEQAPGLGGCACSFRRGDYVFDPAVHYMGAVADDAFVDVLLQALGVRDQVRFIPFDSIYGVDFPDLRLKLPLGIENFIDVHQRAFEGQAEGIGAFLEACVQMTAESQQLPPRLELRDLDAAAKQFPLLFKYRKATVDDVIDEYITDPKVKSLCTAAWPYVGLPPSRLSFVTFCAMLLYVIEGGPHYCEGSFQSLVDAFAASITASGGEIALSTPVTRIRVEDARARGVVTEDGREIQASVVISNADAKVTMEELVGLEHLPTRYVRRLERMSPSLSGFWLFAGTSLDLEPFDLPHEVFIHHHWDHDQNYRDILEGRPGGMWLSIPTLFDPGLAPPGEHVVILTSHMPYRIGEPWSDARPRYEELMVAEVERILPGFRDSITHLETATPETFERWTGNHEGAIYGWENTPNQSTPKRLPRMTPIEGLMLSSAWTEPGSGAVRTMYSGFQTAQILLGYENGDEFMQALANGSA